MPDLSLAVARRIVDAALGEAEASGLQPLAVAVLDARGCLKAAVVQDGSSLLRGDVAIGKAYGALALGMGSRALSQRAQAQPSLIAAVNVLAAGRLVPVPGGVLIQDEGLVIGAVGISGDSSDNDERCAIAGITRCGLTANPG